MVERRQHERLEIKGKAVAYYRTHSPKVAEIIDISKQGLAFSYIGSKELPDSSFKIDIVFPDRTDYVEGIPCRYIADCEIDPGTGDCIGTRRCSVQFGELTDDQRAKLECLIHNFCWRVSKEPKL
jgi:hypothetical protein